MPPRATHLGNRCPECRAPAVRWQEKLLRLEKPQHWRATCPHCGARLRIAMRYIYVGLLAIVCVSYFLLRLPGTDQPMGASPLTWLLVLVGIAAFLAVISWAFWRFVPLTPET